MERRRLVKWVIVLAIAVPLLVEGFTLVGLVSDQLGGGDGGPGSPTPTAGERRAGVGDELLPETSQPETLTAATIDGGDEWTLTLTAAVNNTGETPYEFRFEHVQAGNRWIEGMASTGRIAPGEEEVLTARWTLPSGTLPTAVAVTAIEYDGEGGAARTVEREVRLASIPVRG